MGERNESQKGNMRAEEKEKEAIKEETARE